MSRIKPTLILATAFLLLISLTLGISTALAALVVSYSGDAVGVQATGKLAAINLSSTFAHSGPLAAAGGSDSKHVLSAQILGLLSTGVIDTATSGANDTAASSATVNGLDLSVLGLGVEATTVGTTASAECTPTGAVVSGATTIENLQINNGNITITGSPNQSITLPLGLGTLTINEQSSSVSPDKTTGSMSVSALHLDILGGLGLTDLDVYVARSQAGVVCTLATATPTSTTVPNTATRTATNVPNTATRTATATTVPNTATTVPNTATNVPNTATTVPNTATTVPNTATATATNNGGGNTATPTRTATSNGGGNTATPTATATSNGGGNTATPTATTSGGAGMVDEFDYMVQYDNWRGVWDVNSHNGGYRINNQIRARAKFRFTSNTITWVTYKGPDQGIANVYLDAKRVAVIDNYSATPQYKVEYSWTLPTTKRHIIAIKLPGTKNALSTGTNIVVDGFVYKETEVDDTSLEVKYSAWAGRWDNKAFLNTYRRSAKKGEWVEYTFQGDKIEWITALGPKFGKAQVTIDGVDKGVVDLYASKTTFQYHKTFSGLGAGTHTIVIKTLHEMNPASKGFQVIIDGFQN